MSGDEAHFMSGSHFTSPMASIAGPGPKCSFTSPMTSK